MHLPGRYFVSAGGKATFVPAFTSYPVGPRDPFVKRRPVARARWRGSMAQPIKPESPPPGTTITPTESIHHKSIDLAFHLRKQLRAASSQDHRAH